MSPTKFHEDHDHHYERSRSGNKEFINGHRPSPLKINKESHAIQKSLYSSFTSSSTSSSLTATLPGIVHNVNNKRRQPVVIYMHSPKVIHTQARDFMALVQKLTGLSSSGRRDDDQEQKEAADNNNKNPNLGHNETEKRVDSSSVSVSPVMNAPRNPFLADIPLFTPNSTDFFCSPRPMYRFSDYTSPSMNNPISPSVFEFIKELPEY
ncbi:hypothetical protein Pint_21971 [Pistacia integerrima]|uniref:Uncharacterized protein n=1 Tax=Pistacia integerrima TaxID=434235 RepID=A0ACC0YMN1_9ROSI|nr:hypothetical protein Pint_21971 [Pistacia integerrima]